jgi:predicted transcriptional regulator with HTH domain
MRAQSCGSRANGIFAVWLPPQQACVGLRKGLSSLLRRAILESLKKLPLVGILEEHNETFLSEVVAVRGLLICLSFRFENEESPVGA